MRLSQKFLEDLNNKNININEFTNAYNKPNSKINFKIKSINNQNNNVKEDNNKILLDKDFIIQKLNIEEENFTYINNLEFKVNVENDSLNKIGKYLPNLLKLKLNNSIITSLFNIGNTFNNLKILYVNNCKLGSLNGISLFKNIEELYCSFNLITQLPSFELNENISIIDLEGNQLSDIELTITSIKTIKKIISINLCNNPLKLTDDILIKNKLQNIIEFDINNNNNNDINLNFDKKESINNFIENTKKYELLTKYLINDNNYEEYYNKVDDIILEDNISDNNILEDEIINNIKNNKYSFINNKNNNYNNKIKFLLRNKNRNLNNNLINNNLNLKNGSNKNI